MEHYCQNWNVKIFISIDWMITNTPFCRLAGNFFLPQSWISIWIQSKMSSTVLNENQADWFVHDTFPHRRVPQIFISNHTYILKTNMNDILWFILLFRTSIYTPNNFSCMVSCSEFIQFFFSFVVFLKNRLNSHNFYLLKRIYLIEDQISFHPVEIL